ncbi:MAG: hypothetical protein KC478_08580 [Bacteriovoracaceae bacterium]|nr:hypothetical protein [Bacteriovoracaceae bacterium]
MFNKKFKVQIIFALAMPYMAFAQGGSVTAPANDAYNVCMREAGDDTGKAASNYPQSPGKLNDELAEMENFANQVSKNRLFVERVEVAGKCLTQAKGGGSTDCVFYTEDSLKTESKAAADKKVAVQNFCQHYQWYSKNKEPLLQMHQEAIASEYLNTGSASEGIHGHLDGLQQMTNQFLTDYNIKEPTCKIGSVEQPSSPANRIYSQLKQAFNQSDSTFLPVKVWAPEACYTSENSSGPFFIAEGQPSNFFTNMGTKFELNGPKVCEDRAKSYCYPAFAFYHACESVSTQGAAGDSEIALKQAKCKKDAQVAIQMCAQGNYEAAQLPQDMNQGMDINAWYTVGKTGAEKKSRFISMSHYDNNFEYRQEPKSPTFNETFFNMYSTCVILRKAAEVQADESGRVSIGEKVSSLSGSYECVRTAPWNADFKYCARASQFGDGMFDIAAAGAQTAFSINRSLEDSKTSNQLASDIANGDQTAHLKAQKHKVEGQAQDAERTAQISTGHAAGLGASIYAFPNPKDFANACVSNLEGYFGNSTLDCGVLWVADNNSVVRDRLFSNQAVRGNMMYKMAEKIGQAAFQFVMSNQLDKHASQLGAIQKEYEQFFAQDAVTPEIVGLDYCEQNPSAPSCNTSTRTTDTSTFSGFDGANFQNTPGGNFSFSKDVEDGYDISDSLTPAEKAAREKLGDFMGSGGAKSFGSDFSAPGSAKAKYGAASGGGGSGGGGGGGGGGGTAPAPQKADGSSNANQGVSKTKSKMVSGSSSISYKAGSSVSKAKKDTNPFSNMLKNQQSRNVANTVNDIAPSQSKLFEKISNRYGKVTEEKRIYDFGGDKDGI